MWRVDKRKYFVELFIPILIVYTHNCLDLKFLVSPILFLNSNQQNSELHLDNKI